MEKTIIRVATTVMAPADKVWACWTQPHHIMQWNQASEDWHSPRAENDLRPGGRFEVRMEAKDGSFGFDFGGRYDQVIPGNLIAYQMDDGRAVQVRFTPQGSSLLVEEEFEAEDTYTVEQQRTGWQSILDNFKKYVEVQSPPAKSTHA